MARKIAPEAKKDDKNECLVWNTTIIIKKMTESIFWLILAFKSATMKLWEKKRGKNRFLEEKTFFQA